MTQHMVSRSAYESSVCPTKRYYAYHWRGHGINKSGASIHLIVGDCVHKGLEILLSHYIGLSKDETIARLEVDQETEVNIMAAIGVALEQYTNTVATQQIYQRGFEGLDYFIAETQALIQGLLWSWWIHRLPAFLKMYQVLEVEKDDFIRTQLDDDNVLVFEGKPDGLLRRWDTGEIVVLSFKTASKWSAYTERNIGIDNQGLSELWLSQHRIDEMWNFHIEYDANDEAIASLPMWFHSLEQKPLLQHVQYEFLFKGEYRETATGSGFYEWKSPLLHPYKDNGGYDDIFASFQTVQQGENLYRWKAPKGRIPANLSKVDIWKDIGIEAWVKLLHRNRIEPTLIDGQTPLDDVLRNDLVWRDSQSVQEWALEMQEWERVYILPQIQLVEQTGEMWRLRKERSKCFDNFGYDCQFLEVCHYGQDIDALLETGYFVIREPHHKLDKQRLVEMGVIDKD